MFLKWENNSGKLQIISGKFQNDAINDVKQISLSHVIINRTPRDDCFSALESKKMYSIKKGQFFFDMDRFHFAIH